MYSFYLDSQPFLGCCRLYYQLSVFAYEISFQDLQNRLLINFADDEFKHLSKRFLLM